ncbi:MAG: ribonuclease H-like domain-containing protein [Desulfopila sp.]
MEIPWIFEQSLEALENNKAIFFSKRLAGNAQWRLFSSFRNSTAYIDIETTGVHGEAEITTIALYDGRQVFTYVNGQNLEQFVDDIMHYDVLVSYNGKGFDVPFIEHALNTSLPQAHIDLRFVLAGMGIKGGLKECERQMGIARGALDGVDGSFAVALWRLYQRHNDEKALETLLAYNIEDTVNLERLLVEAYNRNVQTTPFAEDLALALPEPPQIIYQPDLDCIARLQKDFAPRYPF